MKEETQKRILGTVSQVFSEVGKALGNKSAGYEEGIRFIRNHGNRTLFDLLFAILEKTAPEINREQTLTRDTLPSFLDAMDTRKKAKVILSNFPEPDPQKLGMILSDVSLFLPNVRRILLPFARQLPPPPGGAPRKILKSDGPKVRAEVAQLYKDGYSLPEAKNIVARRRRVSLSTVQRICQKETIQTKGSQSN